ncbi:MAG: DUF3053 family protein [Bosea sp. (in: a-proteobacteria)]
MMDRRVVLLSLLPSVLFVGCSPSEEKQADDLRAFIQTRLIERQVRTLARPTDEQRKSFGRFAADYDLIIKFNEQMRSTIGPQMREAMAKGRFSRIEELIDRKADIIVARETMRTMATTLDRSLAEVQAARAALRQPAALKAVYDTAFDRIISRPAEAMRDILPVLETGLVQAVELSEFLTANRSGFTFTGGTVQTSNSRLLAEFNRRAQSMQESQRKVQDGILRLQQAADM